jgi:hypothetical protein
MTLQRRIQVIGSWNESKAFARKLIIRSSIEEASHPVAGARPHQRDARPFSRACETKQCVASIATSLASFNWMNLARARCSGISGNMQSRGDCLLDGLSKIYEGEIR